jgi:uncharacterized membrane protein YhaH (DUF805 family)
MLYVNEYLSVLRQYAVINGRTRRKTYWLFVLVNCVISALLAIVDTVLGLQISQDIGILSTIYSLALMIPGITVSVRRLHDTNRSGWWLLITFVPVIGWLLLLVFYCLKGSDGPNRYGADPLATTTLK